MPSSPDPTWGSRREGCSEAEKERQTAAAQEQIQMLVANVATFPFRQSKDPAALISGSCCRPGDEAVADEATLLICFRG